MTCGCVFRFYSKSADAAPGRGTGEVVCDEHRCYKYDLPVGWRKILSNFYEHPMVVEGRVWKSVEQCYHAYKYHIAGGTALDNIYHRYLAMNPQEAKSSTSKSKFCGDMARWDSRSGNVMRICVESKFSSGMPRAVLLSTGTATLSHVSRGQTGDAFNLGRLLMDTREKLTWKFQNLAR